MKKKFFTLLTLLVACVTGAWAAVTDLEFTATKTVTAGGEIWWTTLDNVNTANSAGWCSNMGNLGSTNKYGNITPSLSGDVTDTDPAYHSISGVQVKGGNAPVMDADKDGKGKKALAFKVTNTTAITVYGATTGNPARLQWSIYDASDNSAVVSSANSGDYVAANSSSTITKTGLSASKTYIVSIEGGYKDGDNQDVVVYAVKFAAPNAGAPTINTQPISASYESGDAIAALTVAATASSGGLSYQWYKCDNTDKDNPVEKGTNSASYTPTEAGYYYCKVTDGNGNTDSNVATITVVNVFTPEISYADPAVTITYTGSGTVYYTTDGTVPSSSNGTEYSGSFNLTNSCTVRVVAEKSGNYSDLVKYDCYVDQSSSAGFLISTGYHSGTNSGPKWTSNDGNFTLSKPEGDFNWSNHLFPGMHGHKMDNGTVYTLQPNEDIKITSIKIVGRTWLNGTAATVAVSGATPSSETWLAGETGNVSYILTKEFAVSANYGEAVTISPKGNQFGCFLEIYGEKRQGPAASEPVYGDPVTWDFTSSSVGTVTASSSNTLTATTGSGTMTYVAGSSCARDNTSGIKAGGATQGSTPNWTSRYFVMQIASNGELSITTNGNEGEFIILQGSTNSVSAAAQKATITTSTAGTAVSKDLSLSDGAYVFIGFPGGKRYTKSITWTPVTDNITLTTSANMAGWRAFYDASNSYSVDANTKVYVVADDPEGSTITLTSIEGIPANVPVILHTSSSADSYKMTLTKKTSDPYTYTGTNKLIWTTSAVSEKYRLGFGGEGIGFYPYSGTPSSGAVILNVSSAAGAPTLTLDFGNSTGINTVKGEESKVNGEYYNLAGQRVANPTKGLYIVNGKKVIVK